MPRNRRPRDADEKRSEIVAVARGLFRSLGYDKTSMAGIAAGAGVTANTIYWYFDSKDAVLVAALDEDLSGALAEYEELEDQSLVERLRWVVGWLRDAGVLVHTVHARAVFSPAIAGWHDRFHATADRILADGLRAAGAAETAVTAVAKNIAFVIEALITHPQDDATELAMLELLLRAAIPNDPIETESPAVASSKRPGNAAGS